MPKVAVLNMQGATVGEMVGIDDKSNFKRQFADVVGMPPRLWREKHSRRTENPVIP